MSRLIDADAMAESLEYDIELDARALDSMELVGAERERTQFDKDCKQNCMWYLTEQPTIDAVQVVRCKECKWCDGYNANGKIERWCELMPWREFNPDWFCADGEKRDQ